MFLVRNTLTGRAGAALLVLLLPGTQGLAAYSVVDCPHHVAAHDAPSADHRRHGTVDALPARDDSSSGDSPCECLGNCQAGHATAAIMVGSIGTMEPRWQASFELPRAAPDPARPGPPPYFLPYANAPPIPV